MIPGYPALPGVLLLVIVWSLAGCGRGGYRPADVVIPDAHGGGSALAVMPDSTRLASGGWSGEIRIWRLPEGTPVRRWQGHQGEVTGLAFLDRDRLLSGGYDGRLVLWSLAGKMRRRTPSGVPVTAMAVTGSRVLTGHADGTLRLWSLPGLTSPSLLGRHQGAVRAVAFSSDGRLMASSGTDGRVRLWQSQGEAITLQAPGSDARTLAFAPDRGALYGAGWFDLYRWDLATGRLATIDTDHRGIINSIRFDPRGRYLATISRQTDSSVLFLDPASGRTLARFQPHALCGGRVVVSPDGRTLVTTSDDASIMIWSLDRGPVVR